MRPISTIDEVEKFIAQLEQIDATNSHTSYSFIKNILFSLTIPYPVIPLKQGMKFCRCRLHLQNEKFFYKIEDISYRRDIMNIKVFGRANEPAQGIFYASDKQEISFIETSSIIRNNHLLPFETITMGVWEIHEPINTAIILSNNAIRGKNEVIEKLSLEFTLNTNQYGHEKTAPHIRFLDFISRCYANGDSSKYKISSAFSNYVFNKKWNNTIDNELKNVDAIVYASAMDPNGINIAIHPRAIDMGKLKLVHCRKSKMSRIEGMHYSQVDIVDCISIDNKNIIWPN